MDAKAIASELAKLMTYGSTRSLTVDGVRYTITQEHDSDSSPDDGDWFGKVEWSKDDHYNGRAYRLSSFNGNAEVIHSDRHAKLWWQPPEDVKRTDDSFKALRDRVRGWYQNDWSYCYIRVTMYTPCASCGGGKETSDSLSGIESDSGDEYFTEVIADLISECEGQ